MNGSSILIKSLFSVHEFRSFVYETRIINAKQFISDENMKISLYPSVSESLTLFNIYDETKEPAKELKAKAEIRYENI